MKTDRDITSNPNVNMTMAVNMNDESRTIVDLEDFFFRLEKKGLHSFRWFSSRRYRLNH